MVYAGAVIVDPNAEPSKTSKKGASDKKGASGRMSKKSIYKKRKPVNSAPGINGSKFDAIKQQEYIQQLSQGVGRCAAAEAVGVNVKTVERHMKADKAFAENVSTAEMFRDDQMVNALYQSGINGNVIAQQVWLYNRRPDRWKDARKYQITGEEGGPVKVSIEERSKALARKAREWYGLVDDADRQTPATA